MLELCSALAPTSNRWPWRPLPLRPKTLPHVDWTCSDKLRALSVPTFAFLNGTALGGGLELALHADYRTAAESVRALGSPEVRLGLIPGWGGDTACHTLLGTTAAARLVITNSLAGKNLTAERASSYGLVDVLLPDNEVSDASLNFVAYIVSRKHKTHLRPSCSA